MLSHCRHGNTGQLTSRCDRSADLVTNPALVHTDSSSRSEFVTQDSHAIVSLQSTHPGAIQQERRPVCSSDPANKTVCEWEAGEGGCPPHCTGDSYYYRVYYNHILLKSFGSVHIPISCQGDTYYCNTILIARQDMHE